jgi:hypothetical protein
LNSIICEPYRQMCLYMCVMVDQREALAVTTQLTDSVYFGSNHQPWGQKAATLHFTTKLSGSWVKVRAGPPPVTHSQKPS